MPTHEFRDVLGNAADASEDEALTTRIAGGWRPTTFVAIDFETANLDPGSACALSVVRVEDGRLVGGRVHLINPPPGPFLFTWVHGLGRRDVRHADGFRSVWSRVSPLLEGAAFVAAHNADFDKTVLEMCCHKSGVARPSLPFVCTARMSRRVWAPKRADLPSMCRWLGIPLTHHDPSSDAAACAWIILAVRGGTQRQLEENLGARGAKGRHADGEARNLARKSLPTLVRALAEATPKGKKTGTAPHTPAEYIEVVVRRGAPLSFANAFTKPVSSREAEGDVMLASISRLIDHRECIETAYGREKDAVARFVLCLRDTRGPAAGPGGTVVKTIAELADKLAATLGALPAQDQP